MKISHAYNELVDSKTNIWSSISKLKNNKFHKNSITLFALYYFFALKQFIEKEGNDLFGMNFVKDQWNLEEIAKAGIIRLDQDGKVRFIHETVAEYFVSDFIKFNLKHVNVEWKYLDDFVALLIKILTEDRFKVVSFLLNETIHEVDSSTEGFECLKSKIEVRLKEDQNVKKIMLKCQEESTYNLALFFTNSLSSLNVGNFSSFISDKSKKSPAEIDFFFSHIFKLSKKILKKVLSLPDANGFPCFFKLFLNFHDQVYPKLTEKNFTVEEQLLILIHQNENSENILHFVVKEVETEKLEEVSDILRNNIGMMMLKKNIEGRNFMHYSLLQNDDQKFISVFKFVFEVLKITMLNKLLHEIKNLLKLMFNHLTLNTFKTLIDEFSAVFEAFYLEVDERDESLIHCAIRRSNLDLIKFLQVKFKEATQNLLLKKENLLQFSVKNTRNLEILEFLLKLTKAHLNAEEIARILTVFDENDNNVLCNAIFTNNPEIFKMFFTFCKEKLPRETFIEILKNHKDGKNILEIAKDSKIHETIEEETKKFLVVFDPAEIQQKIKKITDSKSFELTASLNQISEKLNEENFKVDREKFLNFLKIENYKKVKILALDEISSEFLWEILEITFSRDEIKGFISSTDEFGNNLLHAAFKSKSNNVFELVWMKIEKLFENREKLKKFLLIKGYNGRNALLQSIAKHNKNSFYFLFEQVYCKYFDIKEFAYESTVNDENLLHYLAKFGSVSMLKFASEKLKNEFSPEDLQKFIKLKNKNGQNLFHCAALDNKNEKSVEFLVNFIKNEVGSKEVKKMLSELSNFKSFPLHCAVEFSNLKVFEFFLSLYEQNFGKEQILRILQEKDKNGDNFLHRAASFVISKEVFKFVLMKIEKKIEDKKELKKFLLVKGQYEKNALLLSIAKQNENTFYFLFGEVFCKIFKIKEFGYETDKNGENLLHLLAGFGSVSMLKFGAETLKSGFSPVKLKSFIKLKNKNGQNLLHLAALQNKKEESVVFLVNFIENEVGSEEVKKMLSELDDLKRLPLHCAVESINLKGFEYFFSLYQQSFDKEQILKFLNEKDDDGDNLLHRSAAFSKTKEVFEFLWMKIEKKIEDKKELKEFLLVKGRYEKNALLLSIAQQNENSFYFLFGEVFCKIFSIKEFAYENNENSENLLHCLARWGSVSMLKFALEKLKNEFLFEDLQNFSKLRNKFGNNLLHCAALQNKDEESVEFLVNFIENEVGSEEVKKLLSEPNNSKDLPLHCAVEFSKLTVFEFFFSLYERFWTKTQIKKLCEIKETDIFELARMNADKEIYEAVNKKVFMVNKR